MRLRFLPLSLLSYFPSFTRKKIDDLFGFSSLRNFRPRKFKSVRSFIATLKDEAISVLSFLASINGRDEKFANFPATTFFSLRESGLFLAPPCNRTSSKIFGRTSRLRTKDEDDFFQFFFFVSRQVYRTRNKCFTKNIIKMTQKERFLWIHLILKIVYVCYVCLLKGMERKRKSLRNEFLIRNNIF